jgi:hypothetical protein
VSTALDQVVVLGNENTVHWARAPLGRRLVTTVYGQREQLHMNAGNESVPYNGTVLLVVEGICGAEIHTPQRPSGIDMRSRAYY